MLFFLKSMGIAFIITACTLFGFYKSYEKSSYEKKIFSLLLSIRELREKIRQNTGEITVIIPMCFDSNTVKIINGKCVVTGLEASDSNKLKEFLSNIGMADGETEIKKCDIYIKHFEERYSILCGENREKCRLYRSVGFLSGVFLSIFLL